MDAKRRTTMPEIGVPDDYEPPPSAAPLGPPELEHLDTGMATEPTEIQIVLGGDEVARIRAAVNGPYLGEGWFVEVPDPGKYVVIPVADE